MFATEMSRISLLSNLMRTAKPLLAISLTNPAVGHVVQPADMAVDKVGNLYVVDEKGHRVLKYSADGRFERNFGRYGDAAGEFIAPFRIAALTDGTLLVADTAKYLKDFASTLPKRLDDPTRRYDGYTRQFSLSAAAHPAVYHRWHLHAETSCPVSTRS